MRVLVFFEKINNMGGAERASWLFIRGLLRKNVKVSLVTLSQPPIIQMSKNLKIINLFLNYNFESKYSTFLLYLYKNKIEKEISRSDVVYIPRFWFSAIPFARLYKKPIVVHIHDYIPICPLAHLTYMNNSICEGFDLEKCMKCVTYNEFYNRNSLAQTYISILLNVFSQWHYIRKLIGYATKIIFVSDCQKELILKKTFIPKNKFTILHNPIEDYVLKKAMNGKVNYDLNKPYKFIYPGGLNKIKGFDRLLAALKKSKGKYTLYVIGYPTNRSQSDKNKRIIFRKRMQHRQYISLLEETVASIVPSICPEAFPYNIIEAAVLGRLIISSNRGCIPNILGNSKGIYYVNPHDVERFSELLDYISDLSEHEVLELGDNNRKNILKKYDFNKVYDKFVDVLRDVGD